MDLIVWLGGGAGALLLLGALLKGLWWVLRRFVFIVEAVTELVPNGGSSIKDTVTRTEAKVDSTAAELGLLKEQFDAHLAEHTNPPPS